MQAREVSKRELRHGPSFDEWVQIAHKPLTPQPTLISPPFVRVHVVQPLSCKKPTMPSNSTSVSSRPSPRRQKASLRLRHPSRSSRGSPPPPWKGTPRQPPTCRRAALPVEGQRKTSARSQNAIPPLHGPHVTGGSYPLSSFHASTSLDSTSAPTCLEGVKRVSGNGKRRHRQPLRLDTITDDPTARARSLSIHLSVSYAHVCIASLCVMLFPLRGLQFCDGATRSLDFPSLIACFAVCISSRCGAGCAV